MITFLPFVELRLSCARLAALLLLSLIFPLRLRAQEIAPNVSGYASRILGRQISNTNVVDRNGDGNVDVRDLVLFVNGLPVRASFVTVETHAFPSQTSVNIPIQFSKAASGKLRIELSGSAINGTDYGNFGAPVIGFENISREISLTNAKIATLSIPLLADPNVFRGERKLVLTLHSVATLSGTQVNRSAGPSPGFITAHTIIISEGDRVWTGNLNFDPESGFGSKPVAFALSTDGALRFTIRDAKFFASSVASTGRVSIEGDLEFPTPLAGSFQFANSGLHAVWSLQVTRLPADPDPGFLPLAEYTAQLTIRDFPVSGITRVYGANLTLSPSP